MNFIYPADYFYSNKVDDCFINESKSLIDLGFNVALLNQKNIPSGNYFYRGWMLDEKEYEDLELFMKNNNSKLITNKDLYLKSHYLINWYDLLKEYTPETVFTDLKNINKTLNNLDWKEFFIKDFVKSLTTKEGSIARSKEEVISLILKLEEKKGIIGGICLRKVINFDNNSEIRYFSINNKILSPTGFIPKIVSEINSKVNLPFFSIDIIKDYEGKEWLVEIGDGQVSDLKIPWTPEIFAKKFKETLKKDKKNSLNL